VAPPIICLVTRGTDDAGRTLGRISAAVHAGIDLIQIREPHLQSPTLFDLTRRACDAVRSAARVVVNDRLDVALAAGAAGVHLRARSFAASRVRAAAGDAFLIGRSVHSVEEAVEVERAGGCDYLVFGTVFPSASKPATHPVAGVERLREACRRVQLPVLAIGGITVARVPTIRAAGAAGIAAIRLFDEPHAIAAIVHDVRRAFDT
jgi:thiamine-phosphate diphosphorylase